jgi:tetratricopeptide (TPR) repeat protein
VKHFFFVTSLTLVLFSGCTLTGGVPVDPYKSSASASDTTKSQYYFLVAELLNKDGDSNALEYYEKSAQFASDATPLLESRLVQLYIQSGDLNRALIQVEKGLRVTPESAELLQLKAGIFVNQGKNDEAIAIYKKLLESGVVDKVEEISIIIASLYAREGQAEEGIKTLEALLAVKNDSVLGHYYLAKFYEGLNDVVLANGQYRLALSVEDNEGIELDYARFLANNKKFKDAIKICDRLADDENVGLQAKRLKSQILIAQAKYSEALVVLEEISILTQDPSDIRLKIAAIKIEKQMFEEALEDLRSIQEKEPDNKFIAYYMALANIGLKNSKQAISELKTVPESSEIYLQAKVLQLFLLQQDKKLDEASQVLKEMLVKDEKNVKLLILKSSIDYERKDYKSAIRLLEKAIELSPEKDDAHYFSLGVYYDKYGKRSKCIAALRKAIQLNSSNAPALNYLGYLYIEKGENLDEAVKLIQQALELEADNAYYLDSLGWGYFQQKKYDSALEELKKAVEIVPADAVILEHYAWALFRNGNTQEALRVALKGLEYSTAADDKEVHKRLNKLVNELKKKQ